MTDNFDMKKFLVENKLGAYSKLRKEGEAAYEYEKGKAAGEKEEKEKLAKEDIGGDIGDAEAMKQMDFLAEEFKYFSDFNEWEQTLFDKWPAAKENPEEYKKEKANGVISYNDGYVNWGEWNPERPQTPSKLPPGAVNMNAGMSARDIMYPPGSRMDENFNLVTAFESSPNEAPYEDVESIIGSIDNREILNAFKEMFNGKESVNKQEYKAFLKNYPSDLSPDEVMAYWESIFDKDTFTKAGLAERKQKLKETVDKNTLNKVEQVLDMISNLKSNTSTNSNIPRTDKQGLVYAFQEMEDILEDVAADIEQEDEYVSDYSRRRASELNEAAHKEGDALVSRFIKGIAKKYGYSEKDAVYFIKERLKHLGY